MPVLTNPRWEIFAQEVAKGTTDEAAAVAAGYAHNPSNHQSNTNRIRKKPAVADRIRELMEERRRIHERGIEIAAKKVGLTEAWVIENLMLIVDRSLGREPILGDDKSKYKGGKLVYRFVPHTAVAALEKLGQTKAMFIERAEVGRPGDFSNMTTEELRMKVVEGLDKMRTLLPPVKKAAGK